MRRLGSWGLVAALVAVLGAPRAFAEPFSVVSRIALPDSRGKLDHLAYDVQHERLFVAESERGSVAVIDVAAKKLARRIDGLETPLGVAYVAGLERLVVATFGDGTVHAFDGVALEPRGTLKLGTHADNIRVDDSRGKIFVGFGEGALAELDAYSLKWQAQIPLKGHPEGFAISPQGDRIYVNVPDAAEIAVIDRDGRRQAESWPTGALRANYPLVLDGGRAALVSVFRQPAKLARYRTATAKLFSTVDTCSDADDAFIDEARARLYVICGEGFVDVVHRDTLNRSGRFPTARGARTGFFAPEPGLLFVAARAEDGHGAEIWVLRPTP